MRWNWIGQQVQNIKRVASYRLFKKAVQQGRNERRGEAYALVR
jgi:hypothetical protein